MNLYIHIPFCYKKCGYCAFKSYEKDGFNEDFVKKYFDSLLIDLSDKLANVEKVETLFIGGGTPNSISIKYYEPLFKMLENYMDSSTEITFEMNPIKDNQEFLKEAKDLGMNRASFGVQSFDIKKLEILDRDYHQKNIFENIEYAHKIEIDNINIDLIYGLYSDTKEFLKKEFEVFKSLDINHISAYVLTIEEDSKFANRHKLLSSNEEMLTYFRELIREDYTQYEVSNFCKNGSTSKHNLSYWEHRDYLGVGFSAVSFVDGNRLYTRNSLNEYINEPTFREMETLNEQQLIDEKIFLGLRSQVGVAKKYIKRLDRLEYLIDENKVYLGGDNIYNRDYFLADEIYHYIN